MKVLSSIEGNNLISQKLQEGRPFSVGRMGITELKICSLYSQGLSIPDNFWNDLRKMAGVYNEKKETFCTEYINSILPMDIIVYWNLSYINQLQDHLFLKYCQNKVIVENRSIEPFYFNNPWSINLKGKKVLIVSPFEETILKQYSLKNKIWTNNLLPDFEIITYKSVQSMMDNGPHSSWKHSLDIMKDEIDKLNFDVALLGCGAYGMPLTSHIRKNLGKTSIYIGGSLQILFGITGSRWDKHSDISKMYNEHWTRPSKKETIENYKAIEGGTYW